MEVVAGRMADPERSWGGVSDLDQLLASNSIPAQLWLADSGDADGVRLRMNVLRGKAQAAGYVCQAAEIADIAAAPYAQVQHCLLGAPQHLERR